MTEGRHPHDLNPKPFYRITLAVLASAMAVIAAAHFDAGNIPPSIAAQWGGATGGGIGYAIAAAGLAVAAVRVDSDRWRRVGTIAAAGWMVVRALSTFTSAPGRAGVIGAVFLLAFAYLVTVMAFVLWWSPSTVGEVRRLHRLAQRLQDRVDMHDATD